MSKRGLRFLAICTLLAVIAAGWAVERDWARWGSDQHGTKLFPDLADSTNEIARIRIRHRDTVITLERTANEWRVSESDGFPARVKAIQDLIFALSDARRVEPKTADPKKYNKLQVEEPTAAKADSKRIEVMDAKGRHLADVILGKENLLLQAIGEGGAYLRLPGEEQAWLASGNLTASAEFKDWLDNPIIDIPRQRFSRARLSHPNGDILEVAKSEKKNGDFVLDGLDEDEVLSNEYYPSDIARVFEKFEIVGAKRPGKVEFPQDATIHGEFRTIDGLAIEFDETTVGKDDWLRINSVITRNEGSQEAVAEAKALADRTKDWVFRIPEYESVHIKKTRSEVVKRAKRQP